MSFSFPFYFLIMAFSDDVAAVQAANSANVTTKTATASIHPADVGGISDQICNLLLELNDLVTSTGDLNAVCNIGHIAHTAIGTNLFEPNKSVALGFNADGRGELEVADISSGAFANLASGFLTNNRTSLLPDEGTTHKGCSEAEERWLFSSSFVPSLEMSAKELEARSRGKASLWTSPVLI